MMRGPRDTDCASLLKCCDYAVPQPASGASLAGISFSPLCSSVNVVSIFDPFNLQKLLCKHTAYAEQCG